jgi:hypothetical protein
MGAGSRLAVVWGEHKGEPCMRFTGPGAADLARAGAVRVYPSELASSGTAGLPPMAGRYGGDGEGAWFVPRFGFVAGASYTAIWQAQAVVLDRPPERGHATTTVEAMYPTAGTIPFNQLRLYVHFTAPMSEGFSSEHVHVRDASSGETLVDALLENTTELWDRERRRLTLLFDPGRIKRGLRPQREAGYPLAPGRPVEVVVDAGFPDGAGRPLARPYSRRYDVGPEVRAHVGPSSWVLHPPRAGTSEPLVVDFDRPLDHALLQHSLTVRDASAGGFAGAVGTGPEERSWAFFPRRPWAPGPYVLEVDHRLEDLAGNSVSRLFDRDLVDPQGDPRPATPVRRTFVAR